MAGQHARLMECGARGVTMLGLALQSLNPDPKLLEELYILPRPEQTTDGAEQACSNSNGHHDAADIQHLSING
jgi:hypothetical protein